MFLWAFSIQFFHILWESSGMDEAADTSEGFQPPAHHSLSMVGQGLGMRIQEGLVLCECYLDAALAPMVNVR